MQDENNVTFIRAHSDDVACLAEMNYRLIQDEGHSNNMSLEELHDRMSEWLQGAYTAILFQLKAQTIGYALFRQEHDCYYLRQFFVDTKYRRRGIGRNAIRWLHENAWKGTRVRVDVLVNNDRGIAFWRSIGFYDYCLTLEFEK